MHTISPRTNEQAARSARARRALVVVAVLALGTLALPAAAAVYKWVDPQGRIHYSDRPPPPEGKLLSVDSSSPHGRGERGGPEPSRPSSSPNSVSLTSAPVSGPASSPEEAARRKQAVDSDVASAQADQCKQAQEKYQNYTHSRRLYKEGPNKERVYLSDQELETERLQAKQEVDEYCGSTSR